ncbi:PDDEXK nuclease domain-containing protein [Candidatus Babeliales bacterium]|nr:PDDEXK nuclease domain-containing protein [Candidatus Babeliales bacterium]
MSVKKKQLSNTAHYASFLEQLKNRVSQAQLKASLAVNSELIQLYWDMGKSIVEKQEQDGWRAQTIEKLAKDLQNAFPGMQGFSQTNIFRMRAFYLAYGKVPQAVGLVNELPVAKIPWGHNILIIEKCKDYQERLWYAKQTIDNGLSRSALEDWIKSKSYKRHGKAITNFSDRLPAPQSQLAQEMLKDPYNFDFLTLEADYLETKLEQGLVDNIQKLLLELGKGFAFIGRQHHLEIAGDDYYLDLLFYHTKLHCYCVIELKNTDFKPEYAGKLNFYLSAVDDLLKQKNDNPSIGILLCKTKKKLKVEYALRDINKPIGVSDYVTKALENLPKKLQSSLPTIQDIEAELMSGTKKTTRKSVVAQKTKTVTKKASARKSKK